jgi:hypothetical protein
MNWGNTILSEIREAKKDKILHDLSSTHNLKQLNSQNKKEE